MARNTIGQVAARAGVGVETIRFYERSGLIRRPDTPNGGFREYPEEVVDRVRFIRHGKELGFAPGGVCHVSHPFGRWLRPVVLGVCCRVHRRDRGCLLSSPHREGDAEVG
jgi:hypothetical protein